MSATKHILVVGLTHASPGAPAEIEASGGSTVELKQKVQTMIQSARAEGYIFEVRQLDPEDLGAGTPEIEQLLRQQAWDGYIVGFGIRGDPTLTPHFEQLVNAGRTIRPDTPMGFNTQPLDLVDTVKRLV